MIYDSWCSHDCSRLAGRMANNHLLSFYFSFLLKLFFQEQSYWTVQLRWSLALDHSRWCLLDCPQSFLVTVENNNSTSVTSHPLSHLEIVFQDQSYCSLQSGWSSVWHHFRDVMADPCGDWQPQMRRLEIEQTPIMQPLCDLLHIVKHC